MNEVDHSFDLQRFVSAQESIYAAVCKELKAGHKVTHWMWFIFPQLRGLGSSAMAEKFAIESLEEARAYLQHPILGLRLIECTQLVLGIEGKSIEQIFGYPDHLKFCSCMTLFINAAPEMPLFADALGKYFGGTQDQRTLALLG